MQLIVMILILCFSVRARCASWRYKTFRFFLRELEYNWQRNWKSHMFILRPLCMDEFTFLFAWFFLHFLLHKNVDIQLSCSRCVSVKEYLQGTLIFERVAMATSAICYVMLARITSHYGYVCYMLCNVKRNY